MGSLIIYLWGVPFLLAYYARGKRIAGIVLPLLWLSGWIMLAIPLFHLYEVVYSYPPMYKGVSRVMMLSGVMILPALFTHVLRGLFSFY